MLSNRPTFLLVLASVVLPLVALDEMPDPLLGTFWSDLTPSASGIAPFFIGLACALLAYLILRKRRSASYKEYFFTGSVIGFIPALFYTAVGSISTTQPPLLGLYTIGVFAGPLCGGIGFALVKRDLEKRHDA